MDVFKGITLIVLPSLGEGSTPFHMNKWSKGVWSKGFGLVKDLVLLRSSNSNVPAGELVLVNTRTGNRVHLDILVFMAYPKKDIPFAQKGMHVKRFDSLE